MTKLRRARSGGFALLAAALALTMLASIAWANHSVIERVSDGDVGGNAVYDADFWGASADGSRAFFETAEALAVGDKDNRIDVYERSGGVTKRVSAGQINGNGGLAVSDASFAGASADGTRVFFRTYEQLVANDTDNALDLYERSGGVTTRVSRGQINGNGAFDVSFQVAASADGTRVFFTTGEQLVANDTDTALDLYERSGGTTKRVSAGQINGNGAFDAEFVRASADGTRIFFHTFEPLVADDTDSAQDIYERSGGVTSRVSTGPVTGNGNGAFDAFLVLGTSADGTRVIFNTSERLVAGDTDSSQDVYERSGGVTSLVSAGQINGNGAFHAGSPGASADGTRVFFNSAEQLVANDTDSQSDVYERSGGVTTRVTRGQINGNGAFGPGFVGASADGTRVFFGTGEQLVANDTDSEIDVYERSGGTTKRISVGQINGNGAPFSAGFSGASADGSRVFFSTPEQLVTNDTDSSPDVYERSGGVTSRVSIGPVTGNGNGDFTASFAAVSADGTRVFFTTFEPLESGDLDTNQDVYSASVAP